MRRYALIGVVAGIGMLTACGLVSPSAPSLSPVPTPDQPTSPEQAVSPPPPAPVPTAPLALAVHPHRPIADVPVAAGRALLAYAAGPRAVGSFTDWADLGQRPGPMRVVGPDHEPGAALDAVRTNPGTLALVPAGAVDPTVRVLTVGGIHPLRDPDAYPLRTTAGQPPQGVLTITVVGDIMLGRRVGAAMAETGDLTAPLLPLAERLASAGITIGNLESTLSEDGSPTQGGDSFAADPGVLAGLRAAGFDVLSLANNHVGDWGDRALVQTVDRVRASGIQPVGAGADLDAARAPVVIEQAGMRIGIIATESIGESPAAGASQPGTNRLNMPPRTGPLDQPALDRITADIAALSSKVDLVLVIPHWGTQYTNRPEPSQRTVGSAFAAAGADLVIGGHPHWVQGWQVIGDSLVIHSLGNFVFDMDFMRETQEGIFVEIVVWDGRVVAVEPVPYLIGPDFAPRLASAARAAPILEMIAETSTPPFGPVR